MTQHACAVIGDSCRGNIRISIAEHPPFLDLQLYLTFDSGVHISVLEHKMCSMGDGSVQEKHRDSRVSFQTKVPFQCSIHVEMHASLEGLFMSRQKPVNPES